MRIETLHFLTGCHNFKNRYVIRCALMLDSILRAANRSIRERIIAELGPTRQVTTLDTRMQPIAIPEVLIPRRHDRCAATTARSLWAKTAWYQNQYVEQPISPPDGVTTNMFSTNAPELQGSGITGMLQYQFKRVASWLALAHQILTYIR